MGSSEGQQTFCLKWNHHKTNLVEILEALIKVETYVDCTLVVDEQVTFKAHRVVLAANSPYFQSILADVPMDHCSILFPGVKDFEMRALLEYMYTGEVNVTQAHIPRIMKVAEQLEVKGLFDMSELRRRPGTGERTPASSPPRVAAAAPSSASPPAPAAMGPRWPPVPPAPVPPAPPIALSAAYDSTDMNPLKRKKLSSMLASRDTPILRNVLAQTTPPDSSQPVSLVCHPVGQQQAPPRLHSNGSAHEPERAPSPPRAFDYRPRRLSSRASSPHYHRSDRSEDAHSPYTERSFEDDPPRSFHPSPPPPAYQQQDVRAGLAPYVPPQQKPEWKRYKQYTRSDIMSAIECVRNGMSALQASRKYGVPSRTLYDKVKKLGITTSRPMSRGVKREPNGAAFPYGLSGAGGGDESSPAAPLLDASFLQQALEGATRDGGREALHAMALAAAAHAALAPRSPARSPPHSPRTPPPDDDHVEDLSVARRREPEPPTGVIVPPRNFALDCSERD
ncbi:Protein bric-a-brac 1 [Eumeta japonica]|uniref:Protein bric-a-brac 1 n=1 Tax=Eumeta variegata TaxID=151549 RepID=A0A4C1V4G2_EUMVA|nr:Protein bric-a-brac 1 [Eumeta japonica]